jgi:small subunit ribosomal protein S27e
VEKNIPKVKDLELKNLNWLDNMKELIPTPKSKFLYVICPKCKNEQVIFNKASTEVHCLVCNNILAEPTGGMAKIKAKIVRVLS